MLDYLEELRTVKTYEEKGYARIPGVFSFNEVERLRDEAYRLLTLPGSASHVQHVGNRPGLFFWPNDLSTYTKALSTDPRLRDIVTAFLGPDVRQLNNQIYYREAGDGDEFAWHQDICFRTPPEKFNQVETKYLQTIIVVDEIGYDNAPVEFIPGSHKWGDINLVPRDNTEKGLRKFQRGDWHGEKLVATPGDVLIWSVMSVHGSEQNRSARNRMTFMNGFCAEDALLDKTMFPKYCAGGKCV